MANNKLIAKIHIAKTQLGIEDSIYRDILYRKFRVTSSKSLSDSQALVLIHHFKNLGWVEKPSKRYAEGSKSLRLETEQKKYSDSPRDLYDASGAIKRKIEAMWHNIYRGNDEIKHLRQWLFSHFKVSDINFLDKRAAYDAIEALKSMTSRLETEAMGKEANAQA